MPKGRICVTLLPKNSSVYKLNYMRNHFKLLIAASLFAMTAAAASAQFGIHAGYVNSVTNKSFSASELLDQKPTANGLYIGIDYDINLVAGLSLRPGIHYLYTANEEDNRKDASGYGYELDHVEHSILVPVHVKYGFNVIENILGVYLFAGPTFGFGLSAVDRIEYESKTMNGVNGNLTYNHYNGKVHGDDLGTAVTDYWKGLGKQMQPFDILVGGGLGLRLVRFLDIRVGYDYGLINRTAKDYRDSWSQHRYQIYAGLGVRF